MMNSINGPAGNVSADPKSVPRGLNNELFGEIQFEFGQVDYRMAKCVFTWADKTRFSIPEELVNKPGVNPNMRLEMNGFELIPKPFGFRFVDPLDRSNVFLTTENQTLMMQDKYLQMDLILPSRHIYGIGERRSEFLIKEGTWTMWAKQEDREREQNEFDYGQGG